MFDVTGVGTNSVDEILVLLEDAASVLLSGKSRVHERRLTCGGQTATTMSACAALGLRSRYVGAFGSDESGTLLRRALLSRGVDVELAAECDAPNRSAVILVDSSGHRSVLWHCSDRLKLTLHEIPPRCLEAQVIHIDDEDPDLALHTARMARDAGIPVTSDIEHLSPSVEVLFSTVTHPIVDEHFPARLTGETDPERALRKLRRLNPGVLSMTLGDEGAVALEGDRFHVAPAYPVQVVDNTGAGDVFRAGFIYGLLRNWAVPEILSFANAAAAVSCTRLGAISSVPSLTAIHELRGSGFGL